MISSAIPYGTLLVLYDRAGYQIGSLQLSNGEFLGHSSEFVLVRYGDRVVSFDEHQNQLGSNVIPEHYRIQSITENGFYARTGNVMEVYDACCNHIDHYAI